MELAAKRGDIKEVKKLVETGEYINLDEAFKLASFYGHLKVVKKLVETGKINIDEALRYAVIHGRSEIIEYLMKRGAKIHTRIFIALKDEKIIKCLLDCFAQQIEQQVIESAFKPGGSGYQKAKEHFGIQLSRVYEGDRAEAERSKSKLIETEARGVAEQSDAEIEGGNAEIKEREELRFSLEAWVDEGGNAEIKEREDLNLNLEVFEGAHKA